MGEEEGNVLITANKMDGVLPVLHIPYGRPRECAPPSEPGLGPRDMHFPLTECGEGDQGLWKKRRNFL